MADDVKKVEYQFTGDVSQLSKSVTDAIDLLDKYQGKINNLPSNQAAKKARDISAAIRDSIAPLDDAIKQLQNKFKSLMTDSTFKGAPEAQQLTKAMKGLDNQLNSLNSKTNITEQDFQNLANAINRAKQGFESAGPSIDAFAQKEEQFQKKLDDISAKSNEMASKVIGALNRMLNPFNGVGNAASTLSGKLESFKAKASEALNHVQRMAVAAGSGFRQLQGDADAADSASMFTRLKQSLSTIKKEATNSKNTFNTLFKALAKGSPKAKLLGIAIAATAKSLKLMAKVGLTAAAAMGSLISKIGSLIKKMVSLNKTNKEASSGFKVLKKALSFGTFYKLGQAIGSATEKSIAFIENQNLFTVAMGDSVEEADKFLRKMSEIYGMDLSNLYSTAGYFYELTDAVGATAKASEIMSLSLTKASNDISSLFNVDIETVTKNLASGIQGMSTAVRKYGMDIRVATLQQTALNYGFTENVKTTSEANRQALRYLTMMQQVKDATQQQTKALEDYTDVDIQSIANKYDATFAEVKDAITQAMNGSTAAIQRFGISANGVMGDFARNIETPANQLRIMKEQVSEVARALGNFFIPVMQKVLFVINGVLMAIKTLLQFLASLAGIDIGGFGGEVSSGAEEATDAVGGIGDAADGAAKKLKKLIAPFDELTILSEDKDTGAGALGGIGGDALDPALLEAIENMQLGLDEIRMKALDVRDRILELLGLSIDEGEITVTAGGFIDDLIHLWNDADYTGFGARVAEFLNQGIEWGIEHTDPETYGPIINEKVAIIAQMLNGFVDKLNFEGIGTIIGNMLTLALGALNTFFTEFDWARLGEQLGNGLMGIINAVDWDLLGETLANYLNAKVATKLAFWQTVEWDTLGEDLAIALNSFVETFGWEEYGLLWAERFNGIFEAVGSFAGEFEWEELGHSLGDGILTFIESANWAENGEALGELVGGLIDSINAFLERYEWGTLGTAIATFFQGMLQETSWDEIIGTVEELLRGLIIELTEILNGMDLGGLLAALIEGAGNLLGDLWIAVLDILANMRWGEVLGQLLESIDQLGHDFLQGILTFIKELDYQELISGILDAIERIFEKIPENSGLVIETLVYGIVRLIGEAIKGVFNILGRIGEWIIEGLQGGIVDAIMGIPHWLYEHLVKPIIDAVKDLFGIHSPSKVFAEIGGFLIEGLFNGIKNLAKGAFNVLKGVADLVIGGLKAGFGFVGKTAKKLWDIGSSLFNALKDGINGDPNALTNWAKGQLNDIVTALDPNAVEQQAAKIPTAIKKGLEGSQKATEVLVNSMNDVKIEIQKVAASATGDFEKIANGGITCFAQLSESTQTFFNSLKENMAGAISSISDGVDEAVEAVSGLVGKLTGANDTAEKVKKSAQEANNSTAQAVAKNISSNVQSTVSTKGVGTGATKKTNTTSTALTNKKTTVKPSITSVSSNISSALKKTLNKPKLATGGVVRKPTEALIGEGRYPEAVIPLGNSPELQELVNKVAQAATMSKSNNNNNTPIEVYVYLDGEEITSHQNRVNRRYGRTQQNI